MLCAEPAAPAKESGREGGLPSAGAGPAAAAGGSRTPPRALGAAPGWREAPPVPPRSGSRAGRRGFTRGDVTPRPSASAHRATRHRLLPPARRRSTSGGRRHPHPGSGPRSLPVIARAGGGSVGAAVSVGARGLLARVGAQRWPWGY